MLGFSRWKPRHLLASWVVYWAVMVGVTLGGAIRALYSVSGPNGHGSASLGVGDTGLVLNVVSGGQTIWNGATSLTAAAMWVAGPPLLLWVAWMLNRPRVRGGESAPTSASRWMGEGAAQQLSPATPDAFGAVRREDVARERRSE